MLKTECCYSNMERIMREIMVDTGIELDRQVLLTHDGCPITRSNNPNNKARKVNFYTINL